MTRPVSDSTPSTWRRRRSTARRHSWIAWNGRSSGSRRCTRGLVTSDRRRDQRELGLPGSSYRGAGGGLLACGGVPGQGRRRAVPGATGDSPELDGRELPYAEARARGCPAGAEAVEVAGEGASVGEAG